MLDLTTVTKGLLAMAYATRGQRPEDVNGAMASVWLDALKRNRITPSEFADRCRQTVDSAGFFPSVGEFLRPLVKAKPSFAVIADPVVTGMTALGVTVIEDRANLRPGQTALSTTVSESEARDTFGVPKALPAPEPDKPKKRPLAERLDALKAEFGRPE